MSYEEVVNRLKELGRASSLSSSDKTDIEVMYHIVLGRMFTKSSCSDCYHDAVIEMYSYLKTHGKMKEKSNYALKNGVLLQLGFGSGEMYTNDNLTDEVAEKYLTTYPNGISLFSTTPTDWEERVEKRTNQETLLNDTLIVELTKALKVEGATIKTIKEVFKTYQIEGKRVSVKLLDTHIKEAQSIIEADSRNGDGGKGGESEKTDK